jgi:hypothetical protein
MINAAQAVRTAIARTPEGQPFAGRTLAVHARREAVQRELSRLSQAGKIRRVAHGVFVRPEQSPYVKREVPPEPFEVAKVIAERTGSAIEVSGAEAANRLGLSTQVPMQHNFQTSGPSTQFIAGLRKVRLKHVAPRKLVLAGQPAGLALAALWYLGKREVEPLTFAAIERKIGPVEFKKLQEAKVHMPAWMAKVLEQYEQERTLG